MNLQEFNKALSVLEIMLNESTSHINIIPSLNAPNTFKDLKETFKDNSLIVFNGSNENTIFSPETNIKFRAWHDLGHLRYNLSFKFKDEIKLGNLQAIEAMLWVNERYDDEKLARNCRDIIHADIVGQIEYYMKHGKYVENQKEYVMNYLGVA